MDSDDVQVGRILNRREMLALSPVRTSSPRHPCDAASTAERQGEAIAFDADGRGYVTSSEGERPPLYHLRSN